MLVLGFGGLSALGSRFYSYRFGTYIPALITMMVSAP